MNNDRINLYVIRKHPRAWIIKTAIKGIMLAALWVLFVVYAAGFVAQQADIEQDWRNARLCKQHGVCK